MHDGDVQGDGLGEFLDRRCCIQTLYSGKQNAKEFGERNRQLADLRKKLEANQEIRDNYLSY